MAKVVAAIVGAAAGLMLLGTAGYALGYLYLAWFGPENCCGLEGLYPLIIGVVAGALVGITTGALAGIVAHRRHPLRLPRLALLFALGVGCSWVVSLLMGPADAEDTPRILVFLAVTLVAPALIWVTDVWETPEP